MQKTVVVAQVQDVDRIVDVPVVLRRQMPNIQTVQKTVEVPQIQFIDKVVVTYPRSCSDKSRCLP